MTHPITRPRLFPGDPWFCSPLASSRHWRSSSIPVALKVVSSTLHNRLGVAGGSKGRREAMGRWDHGLPIWNGEHRRGPLSQPQVWRGGAQIWPLPHPKLQASLPVQFPPSQAPSLTQIPPVTASGVRPPPSPPQVPQLPRDLRRPAPGRGDTLILLGAHRLASQPWLQAWLRRHLGGAVAALEPPGSGGPWGGTRRT